MNSKKIFQDLVSRIKIEDSEDEIRGISYLILEHVYGLSRTDILSGREIPSISTAAIKVDEIIMRLNRNEPVQYILGEAYFLGRKFKVNSSVLIPRPETEELVKTVINVHTGNRILDIGTGSGCIPISLALEIPGSEVYATDVSDDALDIATENAASLNAKVNFIQHDILREKIPLTGLDVVVSNPPYVLLKEKRGMKDNVVTFEPHLALFVPDDDPLIFYKVIAKKANETLRTGGLLCVEINEQLGEAVASVFSKHGFETIEIVKDIFNKDRIVKGVKMWA